MRIASLLIYIENAIPQIDQISVAIELRVRNLKLWVANNAVDNFCHLVFPELHVHLRGHTLSDGHVKTCFRLFLKTTKIIFVEKRCCTTTSNYPFFKQSDLRMDIDRYLCFLVFVNVLLLVFMVGRSANCIVVQLIIRLVG